MKKIFSSIIILGFLFSCNDFLQKEPVGRISKDQLFVDMDGIRAAMAGAYNRTSYYYARETLLYPDIAGDQLVMKTVGSGPDQDLILWNEHNFQSLSDDETGAVGHIWLNIYEALANINNILDAIPELRVLEPDFQSELTEIEAQAYFLRGLAHFHLCNTYAQTYSYTPEADHLGIPIVTKTPGADANLSRSTVNQVYQQIISDLSKSIELQYNTVNPYYASTSACEALLTRIYLYMEDWTQSVTFAERVLAKNQYSLVDSADYLDMFITNEESPEIIFQLYNRSLGAGTLSSVYSISTFQAYAAESFYEEFDSTDVRKTVFGENNGLHYSLKYAKDDNINQEDWPMNPIVVRLAEVYLNYAEAAWQMTDYSKAREVLALIKQRANPSWVNNLNELTVDELLKEIYDERSKELCFEGHRLLDIARRHESIDRGSNCNSSICNLSYPNDRFILPIPQKELDANVNMQPNPGIN